ncbi:MAG: ATPase, partial [Proteobacteria bacterium]
MGQWQNRMDGDTFRSLERKAITLLGMSGVGKTTLCGRLPSTDWFHYSGDYRIGTRYLDEPILDNIKREAMRVPFLAELLREDSIYICHNITTANLSPISTFLGKIGDPGLGGIEVGEFKRRQALHMEAELKAMYDVEEFLRKSWEVYGYRHFVNDAGGSLCELEDEALFDMLATRTLIVYLKASDDMLDELFKRSTRHPKPLYYRPDFLDGNLGDYLRERGIGDPSAIET